MSRAARIRLLHWKRAEAEAHLGALRQAGYRVDYDEQYTPALMKSWRESPPQAFVIDLSRLPSHGRELAIALRQSPKTRSVPIVFCQGADEKIERIRRELPEAVYCPLPKLASAVRKAIANRPLTPVKPMQMMDRYASRTTAQKLGIKESSSVLLFDPPRDFAKVLGTLPPRVNFIEHDSTPATVALCFVHGGHSLQETLSRIRALARGAKLWILWRKGGSAARGDVTEKFVRDHALPLGLVDYKICSINQIWSAMLFAEKH